ncbi:Nitrogen permease regulator-like 3 [Phytophthora pseudosyringae]|uniref:Nitrogen permease regulator-like 3 n=1 Tax=Phytophthora pseudosyringae TaxID=221518 RepID=A0A8T1VT89_9STRA|nr:Nitrogen permease regulator-like 3 [Phytophthora pseudosyringae]
MQEELQLHQLSRYEKKLLVKGWHNTHGPSKASPSVRDDEPSAAEQIGRSGSMRSLFATPPGALAYESQRTGTWRSISNSTDGISNDDGDLHNHDQDGKLPKTVAQVKHAYRTRARKQEEREASNAIRKREMFLEQRRGPREARVKLKVHEPVALESLQVDINNEEGEENDEAADPPQDEFGNDLQVLDLPVDEILTNAPYRDEVLRQIRHQLSNGGDVLLQSDCASDKETVKSTRLMLQTLCTQSLAYCVRDQNVVPEAINSLQSTIRLALRLLPRHRHQPVCFTMLK